MHYRVLAIMLTAGTSLAAEQAQPQLAPRGTMPSMHVAHIYYNVATGEKIAVPLGDVRPADNGVSPEVWIADNILPCADFGQVSRLTAVIDDPECSVCMESTATGQTFLDWGDIQPDTVIDCVGIEWASCVFDEDPNGDYIGDGVEGFAATWAWYDAENGFDSSATRQPITGFTLINLPGSARGHFPCEILWRYTATVDLATSLTSSLVFEIGDTDSFDCAGTGLYNPGAGADLDADGLADFGYSMRYTQPGTFDFDGDGIVDGVPDDAPAGREPFTGWTLVTGDGDIGTDGSYIPETDPPGAVGIEDAFDSFIDLDSDGILEPLGTFFYGGFACDIDGNGAYEPGFNSNPYAQFYMKLYGPNNCRLSCPVDLYPIGSGDGQVNFFDVQVFLNLYNAGDLVADFFPSDGGNGVLNFFDINQFITWFVAGCPSC